MQYFLFDLLMVECWATWWGVGLYSGSVELHGGECWVTSIVQSIGLHGRVLSYMVESAGVYGGVLGYR